MMIGYAFTGAVILLAAPVKIPVARQATPVEVAEGEAPMVP